MTTTKKIMKNAARKAKEDELKLRLKHMEAQLPSTHRFAAGMLPSAGIDKRKASAVVLEITALNGEAIIPPVAIRDGLSLECIHILSQEILRSWEDSHVLKPHVSGSKK